MQAELSVVIPCKDTPELTRRCVEAVDRLRSEVERVQIIVVDDGGRDDIKSVLSAGHPEVEVVRNPEPLRFAGAVRRGVERASGEVLLLLNSDTEVLPGGLAAIVRHLAEPECRTILGARLLYPDGQPQWSGGAVPGPTWLFALASGLPALLGRIVGYRRLRPASGTRGGAVGWVSGAAMAMPRRAWEAFGPFDERFAFYCQDLDFCQRARSHGWRVEVAEDVRVVHHHGATITAGEVQSDHWAPEILLPDFLLWVDKWHGRTASRRASWVVRAGLSLRLLGLGVVSGFGLRRHLWQRAEPFLEAFRRVASTSGRDVAP